MTTMTPEKPPMYYHHYHSPIGQLLLIATHKGITRVIFQENIPTDWPLPGWGAEHPLLDRCTEQLDAYFQQDLTQFSLPLDFTGTVFQRKVWQTLQQIPYGNTCSYQVIAQVIGSPKAVRAVGTANGRNPLPVIIPCHRVLKNDGQLGGFAGGPSIKSHLLALECRRVLPSSEIHSSSRFFADTRISDVALGSVAK